MIWNNASLWMLGLVGLYTAVIGTRVSRCRVAALITLPSNIYRYVWQTSWRHQLPLVVMTAFVSLLEVVPLELQRRIVNDAVKDRKYSFVLVLCAAYLASVLLQGGTKLVLNVYRNWVGESAVRELRRRVHALVDATSAASSSLEAEGIQASMIVAEVEPVGSFVGGSVSEPLLQAGILCSEDRGMMPKRQTFMPA